MMKKAIRQAVWTFPLAVLAATSLTGSAHAASLVLNGGFESTTAGPAQFDSLTTAMGWTSEGYNFIFGPGTADTTGSNGIFGLVNLWGPNSGSPNGLPAASPDGGNFVAADGDFGVGPIHQTIHGLTPSGLYTVGFWWAGAQQSRFDGPTTEQWHVSLGTHTQSTAVYNNPSHGFSGWMHESFTFTAQSASEVLTFLAAGGPVGLPPFVLLDGVTMEAASEPVPEPTAAILVLTGLAGLVRRRYRSRKTSSGATPA